MMITYIDRGTGGYYHSTWPDGTGDCYNDTSTAYPYGYYADNCGDLKRYLTQTYPTQVQMQMPWLFDCDEPWKAPVHYPPAPIKITSNNSALLKVRSAAISMVYKQPTARSGFKRGQRREVCQRSK
jgi:hypothetical protein